MDILETHRPDWYPAFLLISFVYPFLVPTFVQRAADARLVAAFPIVGNAVIVPFAVFRLLRDLDAVGYIPETGGALAAGLAEAVFPLCVGAVGSGLISLLIASNRRWIQVQSRRTWLGTLALIMSGTSAAATGTFIWYLRPRSGNYQEGLADVAALPFDFAVLALALAVVAFVWPRPRPSNARSPSRWFLLFAAASGVIAGGVWLVSARLTRFALGGAVP